MASNNQSGVHTVQPAADDNDPTDIFNWINLEICNMPRTPVAWLDFIV